MAQVNLYGLSVSILLQLVLYLLVSIFAYNYHPLSKDSIIFSCVCDFCLSLYIYLFVCQHDNS